jgi:hypothetical protein
MPRVWSRRLLLAPGETCWSRVGHGPWREGRVLGQRGKRVLVRMRSITAEGMVKVWRPRDGVHSAAEHAEYLARAEVVTRGLRGPPKARPAIAKSDLYPGRYGKGTSLVHGQAGCPELPELDCDPLAPTHYQPGSLERMAVYRRRGELRLPLFHPRDRVASH